MYVYFLNVDLGDVQDPTAISLLQRKEMFQEHATLPETDARLREARRIVSKYECRLLERPELGTGYPGIIQRVKVIMQAPDLVGRTALVVDATGVGLPVIQFMRAEGLAPIPIVLTGGSSININDAAGGYNVPKQQVISALQIAVQSDRFKMASLPLTKVALKEFENFKVKRKQNAVTFEAWRAKDHDDIVLSLAIGVWYAEKIYGIYRSDRSGIRDKRKREYDPLTFGLRT